MKPLYLGLATVSTIGLTLSWTDLETLDGSSGQTAG
jgi:hypothetical protein